MATFNSKFSGVLQVALRVMGVLLLVAAASACAKVQDPLKLQGISQADPSPSPDSSDTFEEDSPETEEPGHVPVSGEFRFGSICPLGNLSDPESVAGGLWDCGASGLDSLRLKIPAPAVLMQADCRKRLLTIRIRELDFEVTWQVLPDGRFSIPIEKRPHLIFAEDGSGMGDCRVEGLLTLSGELGCEDPDKPKIRFDSVWLLNPPAAIPQPAPSPATSPSAAPSASPSPMPSPAPTVSASPTPTPSWSPTILGDFRVVVNRTCRFESSCFVHAPHRLEQCR